MSDTETLSTIEGLYRPTMSTPNAIHTRRSGEVKQLVQIPYMALPSAKPIPIEYLGSVQDQYCSLTQTFDRTVVRELLRALVDSISG
jgi:hypothetical protein